ncbi:hypothetical protein [Phaeobacter inhibens]|uniref:hypothetical protein n=1 Tax=Phaeobacter inhibens TaxID=221822 RepID=UPI000C9B897E|nr:hypothetical protein [Phaeobacter inhibens]AUR06986.1 hypothetical protein PhaeoP59_00786 [Phaeobacter inhibens]
MITLAFYKGRGASAWQRLQDAGIRFATGGKYSHVEFISGEADFGRPQNCLSSSGRDGEVRAKLMVLKPDHWDLVHLPIAPDVPAKFIRARAGARYDYAGLLFSHVLALGVHDEGRWFCSEIIAGALGLPNPQRLSPQLLFDVVTWRQRQVE